MRVKRLKHCYKLKHQLGVLYSTSGAVHLYLLTQNRRLRTMGE